MIRDKRKFDSDGNRREPVAEQSAASPAGAGSAGGPVIDGDIDSDIDGRAGELSDEDVDARAEVLDLQTQLADRTTDLQRLSAEYSNYRKRVERDRVAVSEIATGRVIEALLPVLDDIDRADQHDDLTGAFKTVADKLVSTLESLGLQAFGQVGDPFDPAVHEAVMHDQSDDVTEATARRSCARATARASDCCVRRWSSKRTELVEITRQRRR